ncbi:MAG: Zn-ribbon domain-containing OB-fold protein [Halieaceae bacterium]
MSKTLPPMSELAQPFFDGASKGELRLQQCRSCSKHQFYPRTICSHCSGGELDWTTASGDGVIASFTVVRRAVSAAYEAPYVVALIDLVEGPRMMSALIDVDPEAVTIGQAVTVAFAEWSDSISMPVFKLV